MFFQDLFFFDSKFLFGFGVVEAHFAESSADHFWVSGLRLVKCIKGKRLFGNVSLGILQIVWEYCRFNRPFSKYVISVTIHI